MTKRGNAHAETKKNCSLRRAETLLLPVSVALIAGVSLSCRKQGNSEQEFKRPVRETTIGIRHGSYHKIEDDGLIAPGTEVRTVFDEGL